MLDSISEAHEGKTRTINLSRNSFARFRSKGLSGTLRLEHERAQTAVYFDNGQAVYAAANLKTLRLREYLTKRGVSTDKVPPQLKAKLSDLGLASALVSTGNLKQKEVDVLLEQLVATCCASLCSGRKAPGSSMKERG